MQLRAGEQINHYTLLEPLGEGGQGSVWKVVDPRAGGVVRALKLISLAETGPSAFDRARREARILADARHPALVSCHSLFEEPRDGVVGLVMDLVEGRSLSDALASKRLDQARGGSVLAQLADALAYVHGAGLAHRDLKPENVLLTDGFWDDPNRPGTVKLVDFGIAKTTSSGTTLTAPGAVIGTLPYLAPELVDPATWGRQEGPTRDTFAFGVLACRVLLDRHPTGLGFEAAMIDYARAYKAAEAGVIPWPPAGLPGQWAAVVVGCLALRPADRLADGAAVLEVLRTGVISSRRPTSAAGPTTPHRAALEGAPTEVAMPISAPTQPATVRTIPAGPAPYAVPPPPPRAAPRSRSWIWAALLLVGVGSAVGGAAAFAYLGGASPTTRPQPIQAPAAAQTPAPVAADQGQRIAPCYNPGLSFNERDTRYSCAPCDGKAPLLPAASWMLRVQGVTPPKPMPWPTAPAALCAQVTGGKGECVKFADLPDRAGVARIQVTTSDINAGRVYFSLRDADGHVLRDAGGTIILGAQGFGKGRTGTHFLQSGLCHGFILVFGAPETTVTVFLDER